MKTPTNATQTETSSKCPNCGNPMPAGDLAGLCPVCLLETGARADTGGDRPRFVPPSVADLAILFPKLEILGLLGVGGMGAVYRARQPELDRWVALKVVPADGTRGRMFEERFNREARALARLNHPHIVAVHEFGRVTGYHYFLMELVEGANLRQLQQSGRISPREALQIIPQVCDALQYAHDEGVVHRDIKPENVLLDRRGRVKIADFGLARILGDSATVESDRLTAESQVMGTPHYMAPEQVERPRSVDHRADIYSLGVVFYELLTGDLPLGKFPPPSAKRVTVDVRLDEIVLRALENDPGRRYQQASEVKYRVESVRDGVQVEPGTSSDSAGSGAGGRVADPSDLGETESPPDWREWVPFQSGEVKEIYRHYTPEERKADSRLGMKVVGQFMVFSTLVVIAFVGFMNTKQVGMALIVGLIYVAVSSVIADRASTRSRAFLASTRWAKRRGIQPETLRLFSLQPWEPAPGDTPDWRNAAAYGVAFVLLLALLVGGSKPVLRRLDQWKLNRGRGPAAQAATSAPSSGSTNAEGMPWLPFTPADLASTPSSGSTNATEVPASALAESDIAGSVGADDIPADPGLLTKPPELLFLSWQLAGSRGVEYPPLWDANGDLVSETVARSVRETLAPSRVDVTGTEAAKREPKFLHLWIRHPLLDRWSQTSLTVLETNGAPVVLGADGTVASSWRDRRIPGRSEAWQLITISPGEGSRVPRVVDLRLEYSIGPLANPQAFPPDFQGGMALAGGGQLSGVGESADGKSFVAMACDTTKAREATYLVQAELNDGRTIGASGIDKSGPVGGLIRAERHTFDARIAEVRTFRVGRRPVRSVEWKAVRLPPLL